MVESDSPIVKEYMKKLIEKKIIKKEEAAENDAKPLQTEEALK